MAATFGSLNLEDLGVVGEPEVEYAKFETEVSQPRGYDGGVLANFRRAATSIKFNLTLGGTRTEIHNKINALAAELTKGQQELILPTMTPGYHFDASANGVLKPAEHLDGFILPLEFVVPSGHAKRERNFYFTDRDTYGNYIATITNDGINPAPYYVYGDISSKHSIENPFLDLLYFIDSSSPARIVQAVSGYGTSTPAGKLYLDLEAATAGVGDDTLDVWIYRAGSISVHIPPEGALLPVGETEVRLDQHLELRPNEVDGLTFVLKEAAVW